MTSIEGLRFYGIRVSGFIVLGFFPFRTLVIWAFRVLSGLGTYQSYSIEGLSGFECSGSLGFVRFKVQGFRSDSNTCPRSHSASSFIVSLHIPNMCFCCNVPKNTLLSMPRYVAENGCCISVVGGLKVAMIAGLLFSGLGWAQAKFRVYRAIPRKCRCLGFRSPILNIDTSTELQP